MGYIILSLSHSSPEQVVFWRANNAGYCNSPFLAGIYTEEQVKGNQQYYNNGLSTVAVPLTTAAMEAIGFNVSVDWKKVEAFHLSSLKTKK